MRRHMNETDLVVVAEVPPGLEYFLKGIFYEFLKAEPTDELLYKVSPFLPEDLRSAFHVFQQTISSADNVTSFCKDHLRFNETTWFLVRPEKGSFPLPDALTDPN